MRKIYNITLNILLFALYIFLLTNCNANHTCEYTNEVVSNSYLKSNASCTSPAQYYYSCSCGKAGTQTFLYGETVEHNFSKMFATEQYLKSNATCKERSSYYMSCECGLAGEESFFYGSIGSHSYTLEIADELYLKHEATYKIPFEFYKSCACGKAGKTTFFHGDTIMNENPDYMPTSLTISFYDINNLTYGFTYNTQKSPGMPIVLIREKDKTEWMSYQCSVSEATSYNSSDLIYTYYICKAEITLEPNTTYVYRIYDDIYDVGTDFSEFTTNDPTEENFKFVHVSDSQVNGVDSEKTGVDTGLAFCNTLSSIIEENSDFIIHGGDVVEWSKYESYWTNMLDVNFEYLSQIPINAISGNHETVYRSGSNETYKHFNNKIPEQESTEMGYYYSFEYGNVKFIMLNTNSRNEDNTLKEEQYNWLINELENNDCLWTIVSLHNPIYSVGKYGLSSSYNKVCLALRDQLQGIFAEYGVDIVLQGHDHTISRTKPID